MNRRLTLASTASTTSRPLPATDLAEIREATDDVRELSNDLRTSAARRKNKKRHNNRPAQPIDEWVLAGPSRFLNCREEDFTDNANHRNDQTLLPENSSTASFVPMTAAPIFTSARAKKRRTGMRRFVTVRKEMWRRALAFHGGAPSHRLTTTHES
jgi:hypothetical protein